MPFSSHHPALRFTGILLCASVLIAGCKTPQSSSTHTLNGPSDVEGTGVCVYEENGDWIADFTSSPHCTPAALFRPSDGKERWDPYLHMAVISNEGENALQTYTLDTRSTTWLSALRSYEGVECLKKEVQARAPYQQDGQWIVEADGDDPCSKILGANIRAFDNDPGTPGNNGIPLDGHIGANAPSHFPGVQWVATTNPDSLTAINLLNGKRIPSHNGALQQFTGVPITDIATIQDGHWLITTNPRDHEILAYQPTFVCDGQSDKHIVDCDLTVDLGIPKRIVVAGTPQYIAVSEQGDVYVSSADVPFISRISLNDDVCPPNAPCKIPLTFTCNDGLDNDGNGAIDQDDPACYTPWMMEGETFADAACADGVDNDGDGKIDAQDPKCTYRNYASEDGIVDICADGVDNDGDGLIDNDDPKCANGSEFPKGTTFSQGEAPTIPRYRSQPVYPGPITVSSEGDIVIVAELGGNRAREGGISDLVFLCGRPQDEATRPSNHACTKPNTLLAQNAGDPARNQGVGIPLATGVNSILTSTQFRDLPIANPNNIADTDEQPADQARVSTRRAYLSASNGQLYIVDMDRTVRYVDEDGHTQTGYEALFRPADRNNAYADVRNMRLRTAERVPQLPPNALTENEKQGFSQPSLRVLNPDLLPQNESQRERLTEANLTTPGAFIELPTEERFCFSAPGLSCTPNPPDDQQFFPLTFARKPTTIVHDYRVFDENWSLAWEGSLPINHAQGAYSTQRTDAIVLQDDGWIQFIGKNACDAVQNDSKKLCDMNLGWSACEDLETYCERGTDLCAGDLDLCEICPSACQATPDLCQASVQPGDIAIIPPLDPGAYCRKGEENCDNDAKPAECLPRFGGDPQEPGVYDTPLSATPTIGNEYRIVEVRADAIRVEPLDFANRSRYRLPSHLPSPTCYRRPFTMEIIAANSWTLNGVRTMPSDTPYINQEGVCVYEVDNDDTSRNWRPSPNELIVTRFGFQFHILEGDYLRYCRLYADTPDECAHAMRGYRVSFSTEDNLTEQTISSITSYMGTSSSKTPNYNKIVNQLLFIDSQQNALYVVEDTPGLSTTTVP